MTNPSVTFETSSLYQCLRESAKVADKPTTKIPVLSRVEIQMDSQGGRFSVTDLDTSRRQYLKAHHDDTGWPTWAAVVECRGLLSLLPKTKKAQKATPRVTLAIEGGFRQVERPMTCVEVADWRKNQPPKITQGTRPDNYMHGLVVTQWTDDEARGQHGPMFDEVWDAELVVTLSGQEYRLATLDPAEFPSLPFAERIERAQENQFTVRDKGSYVASSISELLSIGGEEFRSWFQKLLLAVPKGGDRFMLEAAQLEVCGDADRNPHSPTRAIGVATDGHRLHKATVSVERRPLDSMKVLASRRLLTIAARESAFGPIKRPAPVVDDAGEPIRFKSGPRKGLVKTRNAASWPSIRIRQAAKHILIDCARGVELSSIIVDGAFPDYEKVIKSSVPGLTIHASARELRDAVKSAAATSSDKAPAVRLETLGQFPTFTATKSDAGRSAVKLNGTTVMAGETGATIGLAAAYVADACKATGLDSRVVLKAWDGDSQIQITPAEGSPDDVCVIMPVWL